MESQPFIRTPACHTGHILVYEVGNHKIYGAGASRSPNLNTRHVIVDLAGNFSSVIKCEGIFPHLEKYNHRRLIKIDWPDYGVPNVGKEFWFDFARSILMHEQPLEIVFICDGGHGRTGTALAIIGCLLGLIPDDVCPVKFVRGRYCHRAVEGNDQADYIERITGRLVTTSVYREVTDWAKFLA